jgi:serine/threonine-protein kinase
MDWGIAGALAAAASSAGPRPSAAAGTPGFMAPEQAGLVDAPVDARADVFALGGILSFLATGRVPAPDGALSLAGLPRPLAAIVSQARERDPARRYPSALGLAEDVAAYLDREPVGAYREGLLERAGRAAQKHRFVLWLVVGYLTLRVAVFFLSGR